MSLDVALHILNTIDNGTIDNDTIDNGTIDNDTINNGTSRATLEPKPIPEIEAMALLLKVLHWGGDGTNPRSLPTAALDNNFRDALLFPFVRAHHEGTRPEELVEKVIKAGVLASWQYARRPGAKRDADFLDAYIRWATSADWESLEATWQWASSDAELTHHISPLKTPTSVNGMATEYEQHCGLSIDWSQVEAEWSKASQCYDLEECERKIWEWRDASSQLRSSLRPSRSAEDIRTEMECEDVWAIRSKTIVHEIAQRGHLRARLQHEGILRM